MAALVEPISLTRYSRHLQRLFQARPALLPELEAIWRTAPDEEALRQWLAARQPGADNLKSVLRQFKQWAASWIALRDLAGLADLAEVTRGMSLIAELSVRTALAVLQMPLVIRYGVPHDDKGVAQELIVIGMGKLGGGELNVSSDIDLIFVYPDDGETAGGSSAAISNFDFFTRLGRQLINAIADITEDGQVFRVDMRLRPDGDSGPLVCSFEMLENYFITQGREWERYAWIKARPLTGSQCEYLQSIRRPFVFRKYLDFGTINALRELHAQIRREVAKKDMANHIKLGPGGIREIEFIAQMFQLIRGGRDAGLQVKPTLAVLACLAQRKLIEAAVKAELAAAYDFLRRLEHRLQYLDDAQTHALPSNEQDRQLLAEAMGFADWPALMAQLDLHRGNVTRHFEALLSDPNRNGHTLATLWHEAEDRERTGNELARLGFRDADTVAQRLAAMRGSTRYQQMPASVRERIDALMPRVVEVSLETQNPGRTLTRILDLFEAISRRAAYLSLLQEYPQTLQKVAQLVGSSGHAARFLQSHPILLDELLDPRLFETVPDWAAFRIQLAAQLEVAAADTEQQMDILRETFHAQVFRLLAQDVSGLLTVEKLADHLSELADIMIDAALRCAWASMLTRHREEPKFAVISYGKLGGKELGYGSDLDLVFLYDDAHEKAGEIYSRLSIRLNTWLSVQTSAGQLFETDLRLRPNGEAGLVVSSIAAFRQYQLESAWVWEHQALTRARFSAGDAEAGRAFEQIRIEVLCQPRDLLKLREEIIAMRQKMKDAHGTKADEAQEKFNLKHDSGGLIDVEFAVQYLVLGYSHRHRELTGNLGNIALLRIAAGLELIPAELAEKVRDAYRHYRRIQHALRLDDGGRTVAPESVQEQIAAVSELWRIVFEKS
ncbi:Glutamine synthetase adenylyl-L-tyrosine phosphorylase / Glutamine synthetase adenylyl transferase [Georgfuchsia toluolica]|uniref:Bifunctional glutamine synthetase adenylyltransferase/adenylyl-removing enzyme n=1 Tax=Georgfuchsia toluolica TaxID=424218 RepID=A0A916J3E0_9PROT|nr:bifunctional [glutamate--ammonia ligase]-adenylyl-L-tyrosine phosphorylase/[glutamate--ammonia-ligase] adenylyltransferase [Georgfuchsia toluolica]CAG4883984.1 Glutamine synthetase adenylyl-L-tyrosine phosphorylase / Glutamine synthetase adenylyl transferase [Georgfuchsia toluolica]